MVTRPALNVLRHPQTVWAANRAAVPWCAAMLGAGLAGAALAWWTQAPELAPLRIEHARLQARVQATPPAGMAAQAAAAARQSVQALQTTRGLTRDWAVQRHALHRVQAALAAPSGEWRVQHWQSDGSTWTVQAELQHREGLAPLLQHLTAAGPAAWALQRLEAATGGAWGVTLTAQVPWGAATATGMPAPPVARAAPMPPAPTAQATPTAAPTTAGAAP